jgi:hypothetical protein
VYRNKPAGGWAAIGWDNFNPSAYDEWICFRTNSFATKEALDAALTQGAGLTCGSFCNSDLTNNTTSWSIYPYISNIYSIDGVLPDWALSSATGQPVPTPPANSYMDLIDAYNKLLQVSVPAPPTNGGSYTLKAVDGVISWVGDLVEIPDGLFD